MSKNGARKSGSNGVVNTSIDSVAPCYGIATTSDAQAEQDLLIQMGGVLNAGLEVPNKSGAPDENVRDLRQVADSLLLLGSKGQAKRAIKRGKRVLATKYYLTSHDRVALSCLNSMRIDIQTSIDLIPPALDGQTSVSPHGTQSAELYLEAMLQMPDADSAMEGVIGENSPKHFEIHELIHRLQANKGAVNLRIFRLQNAFADAKRFDSDACAQLPPTEPAVSYVKDHIVGAETPTGVREYTGWIDLATNRTYSDHEIKRLLGNGYTSLHKLSEFIETRCKHLLEQWNRSGEEWDDPAVTAALEKLVELIATVRARAGMNDFRRKALADSKVELAKQDDGLLSDKFNSEAIDHACGNNNLSKETRDRLLPERPMWAWSGNEVTKPTLDENNEAYSRDVDRLVSQLFSPQGEEVLGVVGRLSVRLSAAKPDPATYVQAQPPHEVRAFIVAGDPSPSRKRIYRPTPEERDRVFAHSIRGVDARGSASDDLFELPAGRVLVLPRGEEAYLRGCGFQITRDRRLKGWDWRGEPGCPLPMGGVIEAAGNQWKHDDGAANYSAVPLDGAQYYRGGRWCNRDGSGTLCDETVYETEDRRDRIRFRFWGKLREAVQFRLDADISTIVAPTLPPAVWRFFFWTLNGHYMSADDWRMLPGQWRWPDAGSPERDTPVQSSLRYLVGPESWPSEWVDVKNHDRKWANDFFPEGLLAHPAMRDALQYPQQSGEPALPFNEAWLQQMQIAFQDMDSPTDADLAGAPTAHRQAFEHLKSDALGGKSLVDWWKDVDEKTAFDDGQRAEWRAEIEQHRRWMREHSYIAYIPDPEGTGPLDGPDARIVVEQWSHDFMPEPLVAPAAFDTDVSQQVAHDFRNDVDQGNGEPGKPVSFLKVSNTVKRSLPKVEPRIHANELRRAEEPVIQPTGQRWLATTGPDDLASAILAEAKANNVDEAQLLRRAEMIYGEVERLLEPHQDDLESPTQCKDV